MCVVHSGRVELFIKDRNNEHVCLGYVEKGEIFGELSLLDNQMRSASAIATVGPMVWNRAERRTHRGGSPGAHVERVDTQNAAPQRGNDADHRGYNKRGA